MKKNVPVLLFSAILIIMLAMIIFVLGKTSPAPTAELIAEFKYPNVDNVTADDLVAGSVDLVGFGSRDIGYTASEGVHAETALLFASVNGTDYRKLEWHDFNGILPAMTGGKNNPWTTDGYIKVKVSTVGYKNITLTASLSGSNNTPRDYIVLYSTDDTTYYETTLKAAFRSNNNLTYLFLDSALPAETADNENLFIIIKVNSGFNIRGEENVSGSTGGALGISSISIKGDSAI